MNKVKTGRYIDYYGDVEWFKEGELHRDNDLPAVECSNGDKSWFKNGVPHRENKAAIICADGTTFWYLNGLKHREDGPALEYATGHKYWYLNDIQYTKEEFDKFLLKKNLTIDLKNNTSKYRSKSKLKV